MFVRMECFDDGVHYMHFKIIKPLLSTEMIFNGLTLGAYKTRIIICINWTSFRKNVYFR